MKRQTTVLLIVIATALVTSLGAAARALGDGKRPADVSVRILPSSPDVYVVRRIVYSVMVQNVGGTDAHGVTVDTYVGGDADAYAFEVTQGLGACSITSDTHVACTIDTLGHGRTVKIRIRVRPYLAGTIGITSTTGASDDADGSNNGASVQTPVHPGKPGTPKVSNEDGPNGATPNPAADVAVVQGRFGVTEAGNVTVSVVDKTVDVTIPLLKGSTVDSPALDTTPPPGIEVQAEKKTTLHAADTTLTAPVGDTNIPETAHPVYTLQLPLADLKPTHTYAVVVQATDLEGQPGSKSMSFKLKKP